MINDFLIKPSSIVVLGASNNTLKPGGKVLSNLIRGNYKGSLYVVNPRESFIQGIPSSKDVNELPEVDLAILAMPAVACPPAIEILARDKGAKAFIVLSAGFGETGPDGEALEQEMKKIVDHYGCCLIGPNCIGVLNTNYNGVFTLPIPQLSPLGCDLISSSGATAVFLMEAGIPLGLKFSSVFSIGNALQTGVEDVLEYMDQHYQHGVDSPIKLLYLESIRDPKRFFKHTTSLISKGAKIAAIKSGVTVEGHRAAASHTGAMASSDTFIRALFKKAGIVYCSSREELLSVASIFNYKALKGDRLGIITHAGGSAVLLTDALIAGGLKVPELETSDTEKLLSFLNPGASVKNPIDFLATGTAEQLGIIIDYCEHKFDELDGMIVVFGSPGLFDVENVYNVLSVKLEVCQKPIFPVLPSIINARKEIEGFLSKGHVYFPDEVVLGRALCAIKKAERISEHSDPQVQLDERQIRELIDRSGNGFLPQEDCHRLLELCGIAIPKEVIIKQHDELSQISVPFPLVAKVIGPVHKTEVNGIIMDIHSQEQLSLAYHQLAKINGFEGILIQQQLSGIELFIGLVREANYGHLVLCGFGGIWVELINDVSVGLAPLSEKEAQHMLSELRAAKILDGYRGKPGVNKALLIDYLLRISELTRIAPEIMELDMNPLICYDAYICPVDVRIRIEK